jgi:CDGSH-type Zn-finger protein
MSVQIFLEKDKLYLYCPCGKSRDRLFCDGKHKCSGYMPISFKVEINDNYLLCTCKKSKNGAFCDGSHEK